MWSFFFFFFCYLRQQKNSLKCDESKKKTSCRRIFVLFRFLDPMLKTLEHILNLKQKKQESFFHTMKTFLIPVCRAVTEEQSVLNIRSLSDYNFKRNLGILGFWFRCDGIGEAAAIIRLSKVLKRKRFPSGSRVGVEHYIEMPISLMKPVTLTATTKTLAKSSDFLLMLFNFLISDWITSESIEDWKDLWPHLFNWYSAINYIIQFWHHPITNVLW